MADRSITILLVEDNPGDVRLLRELLKEVSDTPFVLTSVERLDGALAYLAKEQVDVILLDLSLPDSQGLETFTKIHDRASATPIVVLTGLDREILTQQVMQAGAQDYLVKGQVQGALLMRSMRYAIERKRAEEALRRVKDELELRVAERTAELISINSQLQLELEERKQIEEALEQLSRQNELILNSVGEGLCGVDLQGKTTFINPAAAKLLGYSAAELLGQPIEVLLPSYKTEASPLDKALHTALEQGLVHQGMDELFQRKNGSVFPVEYICTPIQEQEAIVGVVIAFKDITERQMVERMKDEFVSVVSHELRTPLTSLHGALRMLSSGLLDNQPEKGKRLLDIAVESTDRLVRLINDILDVQRIESGKVTMEKKACSVVDLMTQAIDVMQAMADKAGVTLAAEPLSTSLWVDSDRIMQTLTNLLSNAIKFSSSGATVWLKAQEQENYLLFQVKDQGRGIPSDKLESIFERFQQVDTSDARNHEGTGLGLAICRSIVQQHDGQIWAESTLGEGSTFYFTLPYRQVPHEAHSGH
jgi:PAS domain S-box-containing protein